jgi:AmiR/NasT family two-component response regulator
VGDLPTLRILVADERSKLVEQIADLVRRAGHEPVATVVGVADAAAAVEHERPDVAVIGVHTDVGHALDLLDALGAAAEIPVVALIDRDDEQFFADIAQRGLVVQAAKLEPDAVANALQLARTRAEQLSTLTERLRDAEERIQRRAVIERAKGVLMERHDIDEPEAYELLRRHARQERRPLAAVAEAILSARRLLPKRR